MGTERTGPDLTNIGIRQPGIDWNLVHLYNPRVVVKESIMPAYPWMFIIKKNPAKEDVIVSVPEEYLTGKQGKVVAKNDALYLVAYLQSLKQTKLPDGTSAPDFLYKSEEKQQIGTKQEQKVDGAVLYATHCQSCHQANGEGLPGAFPALKSSSIVLDDNPELMVNIIMNGYDARPNYGVMSAVGTNANLSAEQVAAIMNHEKTSWGNNGKQISPEEVKKLIEFVKLKANSK
jgi:cytochrome c oxidase cbb3-type subunit 2